MAVNAIDLPDARGHFGPYGGQYVPETLMALLEDLEAAYREAKRDPEFWAELDRYLGEYVGRPTPLYFAERLTEELGGPKIYLKREDLAHTGAHKINHAMGQILLANRIGQDADYCRDGCWTTRRGNGNGGGDVRSQMRDLHGR